MTKKVAVLILVVLLLSVFIPYAFAATTSNSQDKYVELQKQILELRKQMIDEWVAAGDITEEQGKLMKENMDLRIKEFTNGTITPGYGCGLGTGGFRGGCGGFGGGFGRGFGASSARTLY